MIPLYCTPKTRVSPQTSILADSYKVPPNTLHKVLARYLTETPLSPTHPVAKLLDEGPYLSPVAVQQLQAIKNSWGVMMTGSLALFLALHSLSCGWLCMDNMVALTLAEAAGWGGRQNQHELFSIILAPLVHMTPLSCMAPVSNDTGGSERGNCDTSTIYDAGVVVHAPACLKAIGHQSFNILQIYRPIILQPMIPKL